MKNIVKKSVVDWETDFSLDVAKISKRTFDPEVYQTLFDILEAIECIYNVSGVVDKDFLKVDVPTESVVVDFDGYPGHVFSIFNKVPDTNFIPLGDSITDTLTDISITKSKEYTGLIKLINIGQMEPPKPDTLDEHNEVTIRESHPDLFLKKTVRSTCPGVTTKLRSADRTEEGLKYNITFFVKTKNGLFDFWIGQVFLVKDCYMTTDSFCKIVPLNKLDDSIKIGKLN